MGRDSDKYSFLLSPEVRLIGELLSPCFDIHTFWIDKVLTDYDPERLLSLLKQHRLYPAFYRLQLPYEQMENQSWIHFASSQKQMTQANTMQMLNKTAVLVKVVNAFEQNNIPVLSLKGTVLSKILP